MDFIVLRIDQVGFMAYCQFKDEYLGMFDDKDTWTTIIIIVIIIIIMATRFIDFKNRTEYNIHKVVVPTRGEEFQYRTLVVVKIYTSDSVRYQQKKLGGFCIPKTVYIVTAING